MPAQENLRKQMEFPCELLVTDPESLRHVVEPRLNRERIIKYLAATHVTYVRGSWLDAQYDQAHVWEAVRRRFNNSRRLVPLDPRLPGPIIPQVEFMPLTGAMDIKIQGSPDTFVEVYKALRHKLGILDSVSPSPIPSQWQHCTLYTEAYKVLSPKYRRQLKLTQVDENPGIPIIWYQKFSDILGIPQVLEISATQNKTQHGLFQLFTHESEALSITLDSDPHQDWRTGLCFNLDLMSARLMLDRKIDPSHPTLVSDLDDSQLLLQISQLPDYTELPDEVVDYYIQELKRGNTHASERFINAVVRSLRKSSLHNRPYLPNTVTQVGHLMEHAAPLWHATNHNSVLMQLMTRDLEVSIELGQALSLENIQRLGIYRLFPGPVSALFAEEANFYKLYETYLLKLRTYQGLSPDAYTISLYLLNESIVELAKKQKMRIPLHPLGIK